LRTDPKRRDPWPSCRSGRICSVKPNGEVEIYIIRSFARANRACEDDSRRD
jgi:hypothetical protein